MAVTYSHFLRRRNNPGGWARFLKMLPREGLTGLILLAGDKRAETLEFIAAVREKMPYVAMISG